MNNCPHCDTAKNYLEKHKIAFRLCNVKTPAGSKELNKTGYRAVPVLKIGDQYLNGFSVKKFNDLFR
jgi:glutaredoxin